MRFVSVRDLRGKSKEIWKRLSTEKELVVTSNGRPVALLSQVSESSLEGYVAALKRARAIQAVQEMQGRSAQAGRNRLTPAEIDVEIQAVRKKRVR